MAESLIGKSEDVSYFKTLSDNLSADIIDGQFVKAGIKELPSAAVGGTPTPTATDLIAEIEGMDRGRYAGPVGWMDASGDGEWGIGLRSAQLEDEGRRVRLFAGCGIVADSVPADELAESQAKLVPVRDALA